MFPQRVHGGWSVLAWRGFKCLEGRDGARLEELESGDRISSIQAKQGQGSPSEDRDHDNAAGIQTTIPYPAEVAESIYQVENIPVKHGDDEDGPYQEMDTAWKRSSGFSRGASIY